MRAIRTTLRALGILTAILVCLLVLAILVSQTSWFRDWLRRYAMREAAQFVNGQLLIGRVEGGLWGGVQLHDVRVARDGETVVGLDVLELEYSIVDFIRDGIAIRRVELVAPVVHLRREGDVWNVSTLLVPQPPSDPDAPGTTFRVDAIRLRDGVVTVDDPACPPPTPGCLPARVEALRLEGRLASSPEALETWVDDASFQTSEPVLAVRRLAAALRMTDDDLDVTGIEVRTVASALEGHASVRDYASAPVIDASVAALPLAMAEVARFVPQVAASGLSPSIRLSARGPLDALRVQLDTTSDAGGVQAALVVDATTPTYGAEGTASVRELDLAPWLGDPAQRTRLTATASLDVTGRDVASLTGTVTVKATGLEAQGYAVERLDARAVIADGVADIAADAHAYGAALTSAGTVRLPASAEADVDVSLAGTLRGVDVSRLPRQLGAPPLATNVSLGYRVSGTPSRLDASVTFKPSTIDTMTIAGGSTASVQVRGEVIGYDVRADVSGLDVQRLGQVLDVAAIDAPAYASDIDGRVAVAGQGITLATADARAELHVAESAIGGARIPDLRATAALSRGALAAHAVGQVADVRPELYAGRDDVAGRVSGQFDVSASVPDVAADVDLRSVDARVEVTLDPSDVGGVAIDEAQLSATLESGVGEIRALRVVSPVVELDASGPVVIAGQDASRLTYEVTVKDVGALADLAGVQGMAGRAHVRGVMHGPPSLLVAEGRLSADDLVYADTGGVERVSGGYQVTLPEQDVARLAAKVDIDAERVEVSGTRLDTVSVEGAYAGKVASFDVNLAQDDLQAGASGRAELLDSAQVVTLSRLEARAPRMAWALAPDAVARVRHEAGRVDLEGLRLADGQQALEIDGAMQLPSEDVAFTADGLRVRATAVDIAPLGERFAPEQQLAGRLDLDVELAGTLDAGAGNGHVTVRAGSVRGFAFDELAADAAIAEGTATIDATLQQAPGSGLTLKGRLPTTRGGSTSVPVSSPQPAPIDLTIGGPGIDLAVVEGVTSQVDDVRGRLIVNAHVGGTLEQPVVDGMIGIRDGAFHVPRVNAAYGDVQAEVHVSPDAVRVERLALHDARGNALRVSGTLALSGTTVDDVQLLAKASEFRVLDNELGDVRLTADLAVSGTMDAPVVRGAIELPSSRVDIDRLLVALAEEDADLPRNDEDYVYTPAYEVPRAVDATVEPPPVIDTDEVDQADRTDVADEPQDPPADDPVAVPAGDGAAPAQPGLLEAATLDVRLVVPDDLVIRGDDVRVADGPSLGDLNITVGADLTATSEPGSPLVLAGAITTVRGYYDFQGRRFTVVRDGTVRFDGPDITDPSLDIAATRDISGVEARIAVLGTAQQPRLELSSTPSLDEADILALIVFNRPLDDLGSGEQVSLAQRAGELVGGRLTGGLSTSLRDAIGVDQFEVDAFSSAGPNVTLGNRLGERIYVRIRQQLGAQDVSQLLLEYELLRNLRLQTSVAQGGRTNRSPGQRIERNGIDLLYFFYY